MQAPPLTPRAALEKAVSLPIGMMVGGIGRLVFDAATEMNFILKNSAIVAWTGIAGIVIPVVAIILLSIARAYLEAKPAIARALSTPVLFMMIGGVLIAAFGMSYFAPYSYTVFDTFVKDVVNTAYSGTERILNIIDDMFVIIVLVMAAQGISAIGRFLSPKAAQPARVVVPPQGARMEPFAPPSQQPPQPYTHTYAHVQPSPQPQVQSSYQSYVQRPVQTSWQPAMQQPLPIQAVPKFCRFCGAKLPDEAHFCGNCGKQLGKPASSPADGSENVLPGSNDVVHIPMNISTTQPVPDHVAASGEANRVVPGYTLVAIEGGTRPASPAQSPVQPTGVTTPSTNTATMPTVVTATAASAPGSFTTIVPVPPAATGPASSQPPAVTVPAVPANTNAPTSTGTGSGADWAKAGEKTKEFFRLLGSKIEQG